MNHFMHMGAFVRREFRVSLSSRLLVVLPLAGLMAGLIPVFANRPSELYIAGPLFLLQVLLYGVPLTAILAATGSCHSEVDEQALLATLPVCRGARVAGKFLGMLSPCVLALVLCVLPSSAAGMGLWAGGLILAYGMGICALFISLGMACGFVIRDGVKAHMSALLLWLVLTIGASAAGYLVLGNIAHENPSIWAATLMVSPLDALRIGILFTVEPVPFATETLPALARWWLAHPGLWFGALCSAVTAIALSLAGRASKAS